ncbi:hypothetical protein LIER_05251 [Lithospermum erythrorhizon]|uniref:Retroviral polymerase SH3-like domain-containing protein n=1 Tax=Lithospermum erythrorhizon TaxID=34254 RepID=A0AAV3P0F7_LITER
MHQLNSNFEIPWDDGLDDSMMSLPSPVIDWKTPYQLLSNKPPDLSMLKVFGCLCYATNNAPHKNKFDLRAFPCIFLGYPPGQKAYRLYNIRIKAVIISRDVIFHENLFPYYNVTSKSVLVPTDQCHIDQTRDSLPCVPVDHDISCDEIHRTQQDMVEDVLDPFMHILDLVQSHTPVLARHFTRNRQPPSWMQDYIVNKACSSHTIHEYSTVHVQYLANLSQEHEPYSFKQA